MRQQGYSLVELVVTMVVLVAVTSLAIPAFQTSMGNAQIRTVAESIKDGLQQARSESIKRNARIQLILQTSGAWQIGCVTVTPTCPVLITQRTATEGSSSNTTVSADHYTAIFSGFGTRDIAAADALTTVDVTNSQVSSGELRALRVVLAAGGNARVCDPAVTTSGDPRAC